MPADRAVDPNQMYLAAYEYVFPHYGWAVAATALFVVVSQLKINVTNAYAGSLAWSNFFARLTHSHPGRVVWVVFNTLIALMLMELDVFQALGKVLGLYSNIAIAWMMAVVADLVDQQAARAVAAGHRVQARAPVRHQPGRRRRDGRRVAAVGRGATSACFGPMAQAFSALIALVTAFVAAPLIAWCDEGAATTSRARPSRGGACRQRRYSALTPAARSASATTSRRHGALPGLPRARSARCAARSTRAATTCASRDARLVGAVGSAAARGCCRARVAASSTPGSATTCC